MEWTGVWRGAFFTKLDMRKTLTVDKASLFVLSLFVCVCVLEYGARKKGQEGSIHESQQDWANGIPAAQGAIYPFVKLKKHANGLFICIENVVLQKNPNF